jgi:hypothetical protein
MSGDGTKADVDNDDGESDDNPDDDEDDDEEDDDDDDEEDDDVGGGTGADGDATSDDGVSGACLHGGTSRARACWPAATGRSSPGAESWESSGFLRSSLL